MKKIIIASRNAGKIREFKEMLEPKGYEVLGLDMLEGADDPEETGTTFTENAIIKAEAVTRKFGLEAIADDSGLEIDCMNKEPGVHSARWLGHDTSYVIKNNWILDHMKNEVDRNCRYVCAIAWSRFGKETQVFEDTCECTIAYEAKGSNGFGYDPIIYYPPYGKTMAEMSKDEKNAISHRGKALARLEERMNEEK